MSYPVIIIIGCGSEVFMFIRNILLVAIVCMLIFACSIPGNPGDAEQSDQNIESPSNEQGGEASPSQPSGTSANPGEIHDEEDSDVPEPNITAEYIENYSSYATVIFDHCFLPPQKENMSA